MRVNHFELAQLSQVVYKLNGGNPMRGWEVYDYAYPQGNEGVGCATYINKDKKSIVVAVRGTDLSRKDDIASDFRLALGGIPNGALTVNRKVNDAQGLQFSQDNSDISSNTSAILMTSLEQDSFLRNLVLKILWRIIKLLDKVFPNLKSEVENRFDVSDDFFDSLELNSNIEIKVEQKNIIIDALEALAKDNKGYEIIITGHSLGAVIAETVASISNLPAVTFESPGSKELLSQQEGYDENFVNQNFIYYLGAPNAINTLYQHVGKGYRLYIPHAEGLSFKYFSQCVGGSTKRVAAGITAGLGIASIFVSGGSSTPVVAAGATTLAGSATSAITSVITDLNYVKNQHIMKNILTCFNSNTGVPKERGIINSWPHRGISGVVADQALDALSGFLPFSSKNPGIHTLFFSSEHDVIEAQIEDMSSYSVNKI